MTAHLVFFVVKSKTNLWDHPPKLAMSTRLCHFRIKMRKEEFGWRWKVLISNNSTGSLGEYLYQGCSNVEVSPLNALFFLILAYKFDNLSIDWWIYFFNIPWSRCCSSAQPKETSYPYVGVGPRKDKNHNGNSPCSKVLTLYQKKKIIPYPPTNHLALTFILKWKESWKLLF